MIRFKLRQGFTLIELLIYGVLMALVMGGIIVSLYALATSSKAINTRVVVEEEANFIFKKLQWALTGYMTINLPLPGQSGTSLSITKLNFTANPILFNSTGTSIDVQEGLGPTGSLNAASIPATNVSFTHIAAQGLGPDGIKVNFTLKDKNYEYTIYKKQ